MGLDDLTGFTFCEVIRDLEASGLLICLTRAVEAVEPVADFRWFLARRELASSALVERFSRKLSDRLEGDGAASETHSLTARYPTRSGLGD